MATEKYAPCPNCSCPNAKRVSFTLWGGVLGPKLLTHVKCTKCGAKYNGKTGESNTTGIIIYTIVGFVIVFGLMALVIVARQMGR
jgi:hypothetical protein